MKNESEIAARVLSKIARQVMALDESTLIALLPRYKERMMEFAPTAQWEESMLIYFIINGLRTKNIHFSEKIKNYMATGDNGEELSAHIRPRLRLVKTNSSGHDPDGGDKA